MAEYTLKVRRYQPEPEDGRADGAYWEEFDVELDPTLSVLDGILQAKNDQDGSIAVRCSCRAAICGSCGVKINGQSSLACKTQLGEAAEEAARIAEADAGATNGHPATHPGRPGGAAEDVARQVSTARPVIVVEPMANMPVIKDLVTDMEATHWEKYRRVSPWLMPTGPEPEREHIVPPESMVDVTQSVACIQCGACVSACLSMEADPDFIGPAALAKAYRFIGDPRDGQQEERLYDLANDPHGIYDCTHCFSCIDACPKGVAPMNQIMRLRRIAGHEHGIEDVNNGHSHEAAFVKIIEKKGTLDESLLLQESFAPGIKGKLMPTKRAIKGLLESIPTAIRGIRTGKMRSLPKLIPGVHHKLPGDSQDRVKEIYARAEESRTELNLYIIGEGGEEEGAPGGEHVPAGAIVPEPDEPKELA
ncbi:MAG: succinate dehydrogenase/fumarate reductase iron-sulfur subunit [Solirubrobacterales bacterium]